MTVFTNVGNVSTFTLLFYKCALLFSVLQFMIYCKDNSVFHSSLCFLFYSFLFSYFSSLLSLLCILLFPLAWCLLWCCFPFQPHHIPVLASRFVLRQSIVPILPLFSYLITVVYGREDGFYVVSCFSAMFSLSSLLCSFPARLFRFCFSFLFYSSFLFLIVLFFLFIMKKGRYCGDLTPLCLAL